MTFTRVITHQKHVVQSRRTTRKWTFSIHSAYLLKSQSENKKLSWSVWIEHLVMSLSTWNCTDCMHCILWQTALLQSRINKQLHKKSKSRNRSKLKEIDVNKFSPNLLYQYYIFLCSVSTIFAIKAGTQLTLPAPLNQCCNQTSYAMQFARRVHSNTTLKGGGRKNGYWISKTT